VSCVQDYYYQQLSGAAAAQRAFFLTVKIV
jgi:hypothetical protein